MAADSMSWRRVRLDGRALPVAVALLNASDPMDLSAWERLLSEDAHVRVANRPVAVGRAQCVTELDALFSHIAAMGRQFRELWPSPDGETVLMELDLVPVDALPVVPIAIIARIIEPNPLVRDVRLYFDPHPLGFITDDQRGGGKSASGPTNNQNPVSQAVRAGPVSVTAAGLYRGK